jgi:hypothetical protein
VTLVSSKKGSVCLIWNLVIASFQQRWNNLKRSVDYDIESVVKIFVGVCIGEVDSANICKEFIAALYIRETEHLDTNHKEVVIPVHTISS